MGGKILTTEEVIRRSKEVHGDWYNYSLIDNFDGNSKIRIICRLHGIFDQRASDHIAGKNCPECVKNSIFGCPPKPLTYEEFIERATLIHDNKYNYTVSKNEFKNLTTKIDILCPKHGIFRQKPNIHLKGIGCKFCGFESISKSKAFPFEKFLSEAITIHGDKYDYSLTKSIYKNKTTKVPILCKNHGIFMQDAGHHLGRKQGCPKCSGCASDTSFFTEKAIKIHGKDTYDYSLVNYTGAYDNIIIICRIHGPFEQTPHSHLAKKGCMDCSGNRQLTTEIFIEKAKAVHKDKNGVPIYDYSLVKYINNRDKVLIICCKHGSFEQSPGKHVNQKHGCPKCTHVISSAEIEWLNLCGISEDYRQYTIKTKGGTFKCDGFDPITKTVFEYNGDYYHGNPLIFNPNEINSKSGKSFGELYERTLYKEKTLKEAGYKVISIWESDWNSFKKDSKFNSGE